MKPVRYLRIEKCDRRWVIRRFSPAMAAVLAPSGSRPDSRLPDAAPAAAGLWWAAVDRRQWPKDPEYRKLIDQKWVEGFGDRRQELVFIGIGMDEAAIRAALDRCLLGEAEMVEGERCWRAYPDPFPPWTKIEEE